MGIEPTYPAWKAGVLPLNYTRKVGVTGFEPATSWSQTRRSSQAEPHPDIVLCFRLIRKTRVIILQGKGKVNTFFYFFYFFFCGVPWLKYMEHRENLLFFYLLYLYPALSFIKHAITYCKKTSDMYFPLTESDKNSYLMFLIRPYRYLIP